jgi:hypothetical protein
MEGGDVAAVIVAFVSALAVVAIVWAVVALTRATRELQSAARSFHDETLPLLHEMRTTVTNANGQLERVDGLIGTAENVTATVDSASRLAYLFFSNPLIKVLAFGTGTSRAARRFRRIRSRVEAETERTRAARTGLR